MPRLNDSLRAVGSIAYLFNVHNVHKLVRGMVEDGGEESSLVNDPFPTGDGRCDNLPS